MQRFRVTGLVGLIFVAVVTSIAVGIKYYGNIDTLPFLAYGESSLGVLSGSTPFDLIPPAQVTNPILQPSEVRDEPARQLSDPFMVCDQGLWYMFFEVVHAGTNQGDIGFATSGNGYYWSYQRIVLDDSLGLSYPCVFKWGGEYYMVPESDGADAVFLYKATPFPSDWSRLSVIINEKAIAPTFFVHHDTCWMFIGSEDRATLKLYYAADVLGPWVKHPQSPVISSDRGTATPAGRVIECDGRLYRFALDGSPDHGSRVRVFEINELSGATFRESEIPQSPFLSGSGNGWNADWMNHVDLHRLDDGSWIACLSGGRNVLQVGLKY